MTLFHLHSTPSPTVLNISTFSHSLNPKLSKPLSAIIRATTIPARDRVIDFGKHRGKMLGSLPSTYLKWVSTNLRARDFEDWAKLADQVLQDPVYRDRLEWEYAEKVLNGDVSSSRIESPVRELLEISERYGWDNEDKVGWSKVDFELLGTSKGGRIPRVLSGSGGGERKLRLKREKVVGDGRDRKGIDGERFGNLGKEEEIVGRERRDGRRERLKLKRGVEIGKEKLGIRGKDGNRFGKEVEVEGEMRFEKNEEKQNDRTVEIYNPFPGRESFLKKVLDRKRVL